MPRQLHHSPAAATLPDAIRFLASCCDGAVRRDNIGFKREHVAVGHWLARLPIQQWDRRAVRLAREVTRVYRSQLERAGFDVDSLVHVRHRRIGRRGQRMNAPTQPGWAPDPSGLFTWRWWNGARWTCRVR